MTKMQPGQRRDIAITAGFGLLLTMAWRVSCQRHAPSISPPISPPPASSPSQVLLRKAWASWLQAQDVANDERDVLEAWDPAACPPAGEEVFRRHLMSRDTRGHLARARRLAQQALYLAETRTQEYEANLLLVRIASDADKPTEELGFARRLMAIDPTQPRAQAALQDALKHVSTPH